MSYLYTPERVKRTTYESVAEFSNPNYKDGSLKDVLINHLVVGGPDLYFRSKDFVFCSALVFKNGAANYGLFHTTPDLRRLWPHMYNESDVEKIVGGQAVSINMSGIPLPSFSEDLKDRYQIDTVATIYVGSRFDLVYRPNDNEILIATFRKFVDIYRAFN